MKQQFYRLFYLVFFLVSLIDLTDVCARVLVNQVGDGYSKNSLQTSSTQSSYTFYYAADAGAASGQLGNGSYIDEPSGYQLINTSNTSDKIYIDVYSDSSFSGDRVVTLFFTNDQTAVPLTGASAAVGTDPPIDCTSGSNTSCQGVVNSRYVSAKYPKQSTIRLSFTLADICTNTSSTFCTGGVPQSPVSGTDALSVGLKVTISEADEDGIGSYSASESASLTAKFTSTPPTDPTCNNTADPASYYFPGDGEIILNAATFPSSVAGGVPLQNYLVFLRKDASVSTIPTAYSDSHLIARFTTAAGESIISGTENTTNGTDNEYEANVYVINSAGIVSDNACGPLTDIRSQKIFGVLSESKCYIATATFQSPTAWPVMTLRYFRDHFLSKFEIGQKIIRAYYAWSKYRAVELWDTWYLRKLSQRFLVRIQPWVLLVNFFSDYASAQETSTSNSPYIDSIKKDLDVPETTTSYTEELKKQLQESDQSQVAPQTSYTEELKKSLPESTAEEEYKNYSEEIKKNSTVKDRPSVIKTVQDGTYVMPDILENLPVSHGFGIRIGALPSSTVSSSGSLYTFEDVYGSGWKPELYLHYEYLPFDSGSVAQVGLTVDTGFQVDSGLGRLTFPFGTAQTIVSKTKFSFLQLPFLLGANARFNWFKYIKPYTGASAGVMGYMENRNDTQPNIRGYEFIYSFHAGAALLLDFFDRKTRLDGYKTSGIVHTYLTAELFNLGTLGGDVSFSRNGLYMGFLFEI